MTKPLRQGDAVSWNTSQGRTRGKVVRKQTSPMTIKGREVAASEENPEYLVRSDKSGGLAAHKTEALRKVWS